MSTRRFFREFNNAILLAPKCGSTAAAGTERRRDWIINERAPIRNPPDPRAERSGGLRPVRRRADPEDVAVRMTNVHLADAPGLVLRGPDDFDPVRLTVRELGVDFRDPDRHPHPQFPVVEPPAPPSPPRAPRHRKISQWPEPTAPNVTGASGVACQSHRFVQPRRVNQSKLCSMLETFRIGVRC